MRYLVNDRLEPVDQIRFDQYEVFATVGMGVLNGEEETVSVFTSEDEFLDWVRRSDPKIAHQISQLMTGLSQLGTERRERGAELKKSIESLLSDQHGRLGPAPLDAGLLLYDQIMYGGRSLEVIDLVPYGDLNQMPHWRFDNKTSSFKLRSSVCTLFEHTWFKGKSWWVWGGPREIPWVGQEWDNRISSCVCGPSYEAILKLMLKNLL